MFKAQHHVEISEVGKRVTRLVILLMLQQQSQLFNSMLYLCCRSQYVRLGAQYWRVMPALVLQLARLVEGNPALDVT